MKKQMLWELWKLGLLPREEIDGAGLDPNALPDDVFCVKTPSDEEKYYRIEDPDMTPEELGTYLEIKNAQNINVIRKCAVAGAVSLCVLGIMALLLLWLL